MRLVKVWGDWVAVELFKGEKYPGYKGAHADTESYVLDRILYSIAVGPAGVKRWAWADLQHYPWDKTFAVITKHDYERLTMSGENEFGVVTP